jgi:hypothetical protein
VPFARNTATSAGAAVYVNDAAPLQIIHTTIANPTLLGNQAIYVDGGAVYITNTLIASHTVGVEAGGSVVVEEDFNLFADVDTPVVGSVTSPGNSQVGAAAFVAPLADDYHLTGLSAALNAGAVLNPVLNADIDGDARLRNGAPDIGCDEARGYFSVNSGDWGAANTRDENGVPNDPRAVVFISPLHTVTAGGAYVAGETWVQGKLAVPLGDVLTVTRPISNAGVIQMMRTVNNANVALPSAW